MVIDSFGDGFENNTLYTVRIKLIVIGLKQINFLAISCIIFYVIIGDKGYGEIYLFVVRLRVSILITKITKNTKLKMQQRILHYVINIFLQNRAL